MLNICIILVLILTSVIIGVALLQKDIFTKLLFVNTGTSLVALFICMLASFEVNSSYIDIGLIYFLLSAVASSAYLKYFLQKHQTVSDDAFKN